MNWNVGKKWLALFSVFTIGFSGLFGFGGAYIANRIEDNSALVSEDVGTTAGDDAGESGDSAISTSSGDGATLSIPEVCAEAAESVVEITTETVESDGRMGQYVSSGAGSGVIISEDGYIATNNHVVQGASKVNIRLKDGETFDASIVGKDSRSDMAVLKVEATGLNPATFGDSNTLVVGELAVAIGNPLGELGGTVTEGIISALNRDIVIDGESMNLLQTSAAINPGNSGGGLFNEKGELIGIVNAKSSGSDIEGLGFAIPANTAKEVAEQLIDYGYVQGRADLGVNLVEISDARAAMIYRVQTTGVYVERSENQNGLESGDRIVSIDGQEVQSVADAKQIVESHSVGDTVDIEVQRGNRLIELSVELIEATS